MINLTPLKSIRAKCLECSNGQPKEVRQCPATDCTHYPFRLGKNPNRKGSGNKNNLTFRSK
jgi:hypothetical protein